MALAQWPLVLVVFDGLGIAPPGPGNAVTIARTPTLDQMMKSFPFTTLHASGTAVGLPARQEGNSEAGHMNIGAGRIVLQDSVRISRSINDGSFFKNAAFTAAVQHIRQYNSHLHLMGLLTAQQSAHADPDHLLALLALTRYHRLRNVFLHLFTDGRDSPPQAALRLLRTLSSGLKKNEHIVTIIGRFYAMDRKRMWVRTKQAYQAMTMGEGRLSRDPEQAILEAYERGEADEFISPTIIGSKAKRRISDNDAVIFFNLRSDRARQLTKFFVQKNLKKNYSPVKSTAALVRRRLKNLLFVAMTDFGPDLETVFTAFPSNDIYHTLPVVLRQQRQLYIAESEKFAHVSYFFNGGFDRPIVGEDRQLIPSPDVMSYDKSPAMSSPEIARRVIEDVKHERHQVVVVNLANPDMVGHTGNMKAAVTAIEIVDQCVGTMWAAVRAAGGIMIITADHGNAEQMLTADGKNVQTEHTTNPVPFLIVTPKALPIKLRAGGRLADVGPTILQLFSIPQPIAMTGRTLIEAIHAP